MGTASDLQIAQPLTLKCGLTLPNRLAKAAMAEQLADKDQLPDERTQNVYKHWSQGGWGLIISGHIHVDETYLGGPTEPAMSHAVPLDSRLLPAFAAFARASRGPSSPTSPYTPTILQLNHPGRQSPRGAGTRPFLAPAIAPSAVPISLGDGLLAHLARSLVFGTPRAMTQSEITQVISQFARAARVAADAGFDGVEVHAAHGYLLSQFLSKRTNTRTDEWGGDARGRARLLVEVVKAVREATRGREGFCVGVKLNSADLQRRDGNGVDGAGTGEEELADCVEQVRAAVEAGVDFVEVSGGSYEDPKMVWGSEAQALEEEKTDRTKAREAFFLEFARVIRKEIPGVPLMVTGGFSSRAGMEKAVADGDCDLVGLARPAVLNPLLPNNLILNSEIEDADAVIRRKKSEKAPWFVKLLGVKSLGAGMETAWYVKHIHQLANL